MMLRTSAHHPGFNPKSAGRQFSEVSQLEREVAMLLSVMAHAGQQNEKDTQAAFDAAAESLGLKNLRLVPKSEVRLSELDRSLQRLAGLQYQKKPALLMACAISVAYDEKIPALEIEILRAFSSALDCPLPPVVPESAGGFLQVE
mgnify:CR=1 FL=1